MSNEKMVEALNHARAEELAAIVQYMKHHYEAKGIESPGFIDMVKDIAMAEMKHAEKLGERIDYLGGVPTAKPTPITQGGDLRKMIQDDINLEISAIKLYKETIKTAEQLNDITTRKILEDILEQEEDHHKQFKTLVEEESVVGSAGRTSR